MRKNIDWAPGPGVRILRVERDGDRLGDLSRGAGNRLLSGMQRAVDTPAQPVFRTSSRPPGARRRRDGEDAGEPLAMSEPGVREWGIYGSTAGNRLSSRSADPTSRWTCSYFRPRRGRPAGRKADESSRHAQVPARRVAASPRSLSARIAPGGDPWARTRSSPDQRRGTRVVSRDHSRGTRPGRSPRRTAPSPSRAAS